MILKNCTVFLHKNVCTGTGKHILRGHLKIKTFNFGEEGKKVEHHTLGL